VIAVHGDTVACLGGWRGDGLFVSRGGRPLRRVAGLGWDAAAQTTPQRRLLLREADLFVLEPVRGFLLLPPLRARRFDLEGRELGSEEGAEPGPASLAYHARVAGGRSQVTRCGVDLLRGRPTVEVEEVPVALPGGRPECSGTPLVLAGAHYYPVRMRGLFRGAEQIFEGDPGVPQTFRGDLVCAGNRRGEPGLLAGKTWHRLPGPRLFPDWRAPLGPLVAPLGDGFVVLRREGGELPSLRGPRTQLPEGIYSALVPLEGRLWALREADPPSLVPVEEI
jgi:hypothetical protein